MTPFDPTLPFAGLTVLVTGDLPTLPRAKAQEKVVELGGKSVGSVSGSTGLVVIGEGAGVSKMAKVRQHDLLVLSGTDFEALLLDPASHPAVIDASTTGNIGLPCSEWELDNTELDDSDIEDDPSSGIPWSERHLVGQASAPPRDGARGVEYRLWCLKCNAKWVGTRSHESTYDGCPNDENSRLGKAQA